MTLENRQGRRDTHEMIVITPVKDSIASTLETVKAVVSSQTRTPFIYIVYNDFSTDDNTRRLEEAAAVCGFTLINLSERTGHPSPNYLWILQDAQRKALAAKAALCIVESDVLVQPDTLQTLFDEALARPDCGIAAAVTVDGTGQINYPYLYARKETNRVVSTRRHVSFCCSLLTETFLQQYDFAQLDPSKAWHDVSISHKSLALGFGNYLFTTLPVVHKPHTSRPWKQLKYTNPLRYYWLKMIRKRDKI
ncbi:MAG: glycosyltransferase family 2 protein [Tannerella sp.]|jgi:hypothetical protein|nr:glycosyltransferase family 2 protein [Tannerella sp.]